MNFKKDRKKIKFLLIIFAITLFIFAIIVGINSPDKNNNQMKGYGMDCFEKCNTYCDKKGERPTNFIAVEDICKCVCSDNTHVSLD